MLKALSILLMVVAVIGCDAFVPMLDGTGHVQTVSGGFLINSGKLQYGMTYKTIDPGPGVPLYGIVLFENPEFKPMPLRLTLGELSWSTDIIAQSPPLDAIRNDTSYSVVLYIYADKRMTKLILRHSDQVRFSMPPAVLEQLGVRLL